jgi:hypothetical protein
LEDLGVYERTILKSILKMWNGDIYLIDLAVDRDMQLAFIKAVMKLPVPQNAGNSLAGLGHFTF